MSKKGTTALESSVFAKLMAGVAAIIPPETVDSASEREPDDVVAAECDEFLRRIHAYHTELAEVLRPLERELRGLQRDIAGAAQFIQGKAQTVPELFAAMEGMLTPENKAKVARIAELEAELSPQVMYLKWVGDFFWVEAKNRFPALHGHPNISLRSDWSIVALDDKKSELEEGLEGLIASLGGGGLERMLRRRAA